MSVQVPARSRVALRSAARRRRELPLYRNGYALVASSALTSGFGLVFWLVAARSYSTVAVGVASALISASTTIANLAHLNLKSALNRFLPRAGRRTRRLVVHSYLVAVAVAAVGAAVFVALLTTVEPRLGLLRHQPLLELWFVVATAGWTVFVLQDSVLTGIRSAGWVPIENAAYAVVKLVLLPALVVLSPRLGVFLAWTLPIPAVLVAVNLLLFRRLLGPHARAADEEHVGVRAMVRYVAADYLAYVAMTATIGLLPLVVLGTLGARENAYYFVAWSIAYGLYLIPSSMGSSMISEAAMAPDELHGFGRDSLIETVVLMIPCVVVVVVGAPWILALLGHGYRTGGAGVLRLLALSALPWTVFVAYANAARVQRRMGAVVRAHLTLFGLVLAIGIPLMGPLGVDGLGVGWLGAQCLVALAILAVRAAPRLPLPVATALALPALVGQRLARGHTHRSEATARALTTALNAQAGCRDWVLGLDQPALNDVVLTPVGPPGSPPQGYLRRALTPAGGRSLWPTARTLLELRRVPRLTAFTTLAPRLLGSGVADGMPFLLEQRLPGETLETRLQHSRGVEPQALIRAAALAVVPLHAVTSRQVRVDPPLVTELVHRPVEQLRQVVARHRRGRRGRQTLIDLERVRHELRDLLLGRTIVVSRIHGDLSPGNVLLSPNDVVTGIVDWEASTASAPPELDLVQLVASTRACAQGRPLGEIFAELLAQSARPGEPLPLIEAGGPLPARALVLMAWLRHVAGNLVKSERYAGSPAWFRRAVAPVLGQLALGPPGGDAGESARTAARRVPARLAERWPVGALAVAGLLWLGSLPGIDPRAMTDLGLLSVLPLTYALALFLLTGSFVTLVHRRRAPVWLLVAHLVALAAILHGTPAIVYGTLRYPWAFKHVGVVDYISRHAAIAPNLGQLTVYQDWPGFFALGALFGKLAGLSSLLAVARWAPLFNNLLYLPALLFLFSSLTRERRVAWLACWIFYVADWVGQDYFSPQAFAFLLYLVLLGVMIRWLAPGTHAAGRARSAATGLCVLLITAIATSHALTAAMVCLSLAALVLAGVSSRWTLPLVALGITAAWDAGPGWRYTGIQLGPTLASIHLPWATTSDNLTTLSRLTGDQAHVAEVARGLTLIVALLAGAGALAAWRDGRLRRATVVLAATPILLFAAGNYDGEMLFRIFLFAVPLLALLAAQGLIGARHRLRSPALTASVLCLLLSGFLVAYYGDERTNYFTPQEVGAAQWLDRHAPPGSLLIDGTGNDLLQIANYERFSYVSIALEPPGSRSRLLADPVGVLSAWMSTPQHRRAYLFLSRSQELVVHEQGVLPPGSLQRLQRTLLSSGRFRIVFGNRDAVVIGLSPARRPAA